MIDKNEMRIGNYFIGEDKILWLSQIRHAENVKEWSYKGWHEETKERIEVNFFEAEPIPLTTEILLKCGFEEISTYGDFWKDDVSIGISYDKECELSLYNNIDLEVHPNELKYLHQLQNLYYCLTGKELEWQNI